MAPLMDWKCILLFVTISAVSTERIKDMIYMPLDGVAACFRRHNGTNQFGCSSSRSGSVGVIHVIEGEEELAWLEINGTAGPYTAVVPFPMFTKDTLVRLRDTDNINGVLLARNISAHDRPSTYSPEDTCPNRYSGFKQCDSTKPWNPSGSALLMEDWPFPMFYMQNQTQLEAIKDCFLTHNAKNRDTQIQRPLCALEMTSFMFAAVDSETCTKRSASKINFNPTQFCDPLGDRNIHWPLAPLNDNMESVIMITARLDASSLFDGFAPGAGSAVTGLVTLLASAYYLNTLNATVNKTNVVFSLLNGEAFDYIGSSRLVYDLKEGNFNALGGKNLALDQIQAVIELGQLGEGKLFFHANNYELNSLVDELKKVLDPVILKDSVPPASIQRFLAEKTNMTAVVIANHGLEFVNQYYHGILDDAGSLHFNTDSGRLRLATSLANVSVELGNQLYKSVTGSNPPATNATVIEDLISKMLSCYLENANCSLFRAASSPGTKLADDTIPLYVSVNRWPNQATSLTGQLLALLTGEKLPEMNITTCHEHHLAWMGGDNFKGICINSTVNYTIATSPAFIIDGYDMKSGMYSTWTESVWQVLSMRMFVKPPPAAERLSMIVGSIVAVASFIVVWFINSRANLLFNANGAPDC